MHDDIKFDSEMKSIAKILLRSFAESYYLSGMINEEDLNNVEKIRSLMLEALNHPDGLHVITDYRNGLLTKAKKFVESNELEMAIVVYGMFFEHSINSIISQVLERNLFDNKVKNEILKGANLKAKFTWILALLNLPKFNIQHEKFILKLSDERNAFVHYKFNAIHIDKAHNKHLLEILNHIHKSVKYMKTYESKALFDGKKNTVKSKLSQL